MRLAACTIALLTLSACAPSHDLYLGSDIRADAGSSTLTPDAAGEPVPSSTSTDASSVAAPAVEDAGMPPRAGAPAMPMQMPAPPGPLTCANGTGDCDEDAGNGCETDLFADEKHCGVCGAACPTADCECQAGKAVTVCRRGRADCDQNPANGCEVDIDTSMQNCGACGRSCHTNGHDAITAVCEAGRCRLTCESELFPELDCDGNPDNGCETSIWTDNQNCGACGVRCTCADGVCAGT